jgi:uncharacterized protein (TIGR00255 family)
MNRVQSMTGFATANVLFAGGSLHLELKGVNSRFLDLHFKIADDLRHYEMGLRETLTANVTRGKVECRLYYALSHEKSAGDTVNDSLLSKLSALQQIIQTALPGTPALTAAEILRWPGMIGDQSVDFTVLGEEVKLALGAALADFTSSRVREGEKLASMIWERVAAILKLIGQVEPLIPEAQTNYAEKLRQKLLEVLSSADEDRIRQEIAVYATRIDVAEELSRLRTHLGEVERVLTQGGAVGKRLDFLMQELNREANTLGSKSVVSLVSQAAMEMKLLIEQMREQVQNLA